MRLEDLEQELAEVQSGYRALDANWASLHESSMGAIRDALKLPDASVPEMVAEIERLSVKSPRREEPLCLLRLP